MTVDLSPKKLLGISIGTLLVLFATFVAGRFSKPDKTITIHDKGETKIEYQTKVVYVEKKTKKHVETTTSTTKKNDGTETTTTKKVEDSGSDTDKHSVGDTLENDRKTEHNYQLVENAKPSWRVGILAGLHPGELNLSAVNYGLSVDKRVIGTVWGGVWVLSDPHNIKPSTVVGLSLSLEF